MFEIEQANLENCGLLATTHLTLTKIKYQGHSMMPMERALSQGLCMANINALPFILQKI